MSDFDSMLWRPIKNGMQFNSLFPASTCTKTDIGSGNTDFSIKEMNALVSKYAYQTELVSKILEKDNLQNTCNAIKDFVFNYFQYKADGEDQMLRSPACSWHDRAIGIDCKSYSILASCILTNLGIKHYIRRIKQAGYAPEQYTHVYVVVPTDQQTADLQKGSICIDGTLEQSSEPSFLIKSDLYMNLQHYALNGMRQIAPSGPPPSSTNPNQNPETKIDFNKILDAIKKINFSKINELFAKIACWDRSAYDPNGLKLNIVKINNYFTEIITSMNKNLVDNNIDEFRLDVADFIGESKLFQKTFEVKLAEKWNACTSGNFRTTITLCNFYRDTVSKALVIYLNEYFINSGTQAPITLTSVGLEEVKGIWGMSLRNPQSIVQEVIKWTPKEKLIPAFVITPAVINSNSSLMNTIDFLKELVIVAADYTPSNNNNNNNNGNPNNNPDLPSNTTQAGFGAIGWLMVVGAILYGVKQFSGTNKK